MLKKSLEVSKIGNTNHATLQDLTPYRSSLPKVTFVRAEVDEIIVEFLLPIDIKTKLTEYLATIEKQVDNIHLLQAKIKLENFYPVMRAALREINDLTQEIFLLTKNYNSVLANTLKKTLLEWIYPLSKELDKRLEMLPDARDALEFKTKRLYAQQGFIARQPMLEEALIGQLEKIKLLFTETGKVAPPCYISYAWPSQENKEIEFWVQPFLCILYDHLKAAGVKVVMDVKDNLAGNSIYEFMERLNDGHYVILVGSESLLEKHQNRQNHSVKTELSIIADKYEQDHEQYGNSRIYPLLISGTIKTSYPAIYNKYRSVQDGRDFGYLGLIWRLINWLQHDRIERDKEIEQKYLNLQTGLSAFGKNYQELAIDGNEMKVLTESDSNHHRKVLVDLQQELQYQSVHAQLEVKHSSVVAVYMESRGTISQKLFDETGHQFQRPYSNSDFVQRQDLWDKMTEHFASRAQQILTLTAKGLGGMGKTELAARYYLNPPRPYSLRAWFNVENKEQLYIQYIDLIKEAKHVEYPEEMPTEEKAKLVKKWLEEQKDCLLIYDNVSNFAEIAALLPQQGKHHILVTSRNAADWSSQQSLDVDVMTEAEAIQLIVKINNLDEKTHSEHLKKLVNTLGCLPLALAQAAAYINEGQVTIADYLELYNKYIAQPELLNYTNRAAYGPKHEPIWVTFDINFKSLKEQCEMALLTLQIASFLDRERIPESLFLYLLHIGDSVTVEDVKLMWVAIKKYIRRYSLMRIDCERQILSIHPLLQNILQDRMSSKVKLQIFGLLSSKFDSLIKAFKSEYNISYKDLLIHTEAVHKYASDMRSIAEELEHNNYKLVQLQPFFLGNIYIDFGLIQKALIFLMKQKKVITECFGEQDINIVCTLNLLAVCHQKLGAYEEAKKYHEQALAIKEAQYVKDQPDIALTLHNLGNVYKQQADFSKAQMYYEKSLKVYQGSDHNNDRRMAVVLNSLGALCFSQQKYEQAKAYYEQAVSLEQKQDEPDHKALAEGFSNLGAIHAQFESFQDAIAFFEKAHAIKIKYFGKDHPEVASLLVVMAALSIKQGDYATAKRNSETALSIFKAYYNEDHIAMSGALINLAGCYTHFDNLSDAKQAYIRALEINKKYDSENHFAMQPILTNLRTICLRLNDVHGASHYFSSAQVNIYQTKNKL